MAAAACHPLALTAAPNQGLAVPGEPMFPLFRRQKKPTQAPPEALWQITEGVGGQRGWYSWPLAWRARGWLDRAIGGTGLRHRRRDPHHLRVGDALDFCRVEAIEPGHLPRLRAEMKLPGLDWPR